MKSIVSLLLIFPFLSWSQKDDIITLIDINEVVVSGHLKVVVTKGTGTLEFIGSKEFDASDIDIKQKRGVLKMSLINGKFKDNPPTAYVGLETLKRISANGHARVKNKDIWNLKNIELDVRAGGHINMRLESNLIEANVSQGGTIILMGSAKKVELGVTTGGTIGSFNLDVIESKANVNAGGEIYTNPSELLSAQVRGGGKIYFKTAANIINKKTLGGSIEQVNHQKNDN